MINSTRIYSTRPTDRATGRWAKPTALVLTSLLLTCSWVGTTLADEPPDDDSETRVVIRERIRNCPEIRFGGGLQGLGSTSGGFLGVELTNLSPELRSHFGVPDDQGTMVSRVVEDSAAAQAGLRVGDIITAIDGTSVGSSSSLGRAVRQHEGGAVVAVDYFREGRLSQTEATLQEAERCAVDVSEILGDIDWAEIGRAGEVAIEGIEWEDFAEQFELSEEALEGALEGLRHAFENQDWSQHFESLENFEFNFDFEGLEERMEHLQERLEELEEEIEREAEEVGEELERELERHHNQAALEQTRAELSQLAALAVEAPGVGVVPGLASPDVMVEPLAVVEPLTVDPVIFSGPLVLLEPETADDC